MYLSEADVDPFDLDLPCGEGRPQRREAHFEDGHQVGHPAADGQEAGDAGLEVLGGHLYVIGKKITSIRVPKAVFTFGVAEQV